MDILNNPGALWRIFEHNSKSVRHPHGMDYALLKMYQQHVLGCGRVSFGTPNHVRGVMMVTEDANDRGNPRAIVPSHKDDIRRSVDADKHDYMYPIIVAVPRRLLDPDMIQRLAESPPFQRFSFPPLLRLNNTTEEEDKLEYEIACERVHGAPDDQFLTRKEVNDRKVRLRRLRSGRELCRLVNGNHRTHVCMERATELLEPVRRELIELQRLFWVEKDESVKEEMLDKAAQLKLMMADHSWQVLVIAGMLLYFWKCCY